MNKQKGYELERVKTKDWDEHLNNISFFSATGRLVDHHITELNEAGTECIYSVLVKKD